MFDVVIVGGGPAGCATALSLAAHASSLSVLLVEASSYDVARLGETLPPVATTLLEHLGVMPAFIDQAHRATYGTASAWGACGLVDNDFVFGARGAGWHLDRAAFDAMLAREAVACGAALVCGTRVTGIGGGAGDWEVSLSSGCAVRARVVVDASGSSGVVARRMGTRGVAADRLTGFASFYEGTGASDSRTLVEAFSEGWWYTAALPTGLRVVTCMTDADVGRRRRSASVAEWATSLAETTHVAEAVRGLRRVGAIVVRPARSRISEPAAAEGWLAVGDAASSVDPLSSQGICRALRSGVFASYAIADLLVRERPDAFERYQRFVRSEFDGYLEARARYYAIEQRWPASEFWRRRHGERSRASSELGVAGLDVAAAGSL
jgi:flavin-dependent dehydrogenase